MIWLLALILAMSAPAAVEATTRYASPSGTGSPNTCTASGSPCSVSRILAVAVCGDVLRFQDGEYTGSPALSVTSGTTSAITCTAGSPMTLQADNDGGALFTGPNDATAAAVRISGATYWTFSGFNARRGYDVLEVVSSSHVTLQRIVAWDAPNVNVNSQVILIQDSANVLVEDVAAFGLATETMLDFGTNSNNTWRRVWIRTEGWTGATGGPSVAVQFNYTSDNYANPGLFENVIMTSQSARAGSTDYIDNTARHNAQSPFIRQYGHILYAGSGAATNLGFLMRDGGGPACNGYLIQDTIVHHNGTNPSLGPINNQSQDTTNGCDSPGISGQRQFTRVTSVRGTTASDLKGASTTNFIEATTVGGTGFDYQGASNTAKLCFRYVDGTYTSTPLWPWPMDDRIKSAIASNSGSASLAGSAGNGYAAGTVTSEIVSLFGSIPTACNSSTFTPSFPVASDFPSVSVRDDFTRANAPTLGAGWTELTADTFSIVSNAAVAPTGGGGFARTIYSDTQMQLSHEVYATWTTLPTNTGGFNSMLSFAGTDLTANNQYRVRYSASSGSNSQVDVVRIDSVGSSTTIMSAVDLGVAAVDGNSLGVRVSGSTISVYWKWTDGVWYRIGQFTDANLPASGSVYGGISGVSGVVIDNYGAGPFVDQPVQNPPSPPASVGVSRFGTTFPGRR